MSAIVRELPRRLPNRAGAPDANDTARRVSLMHEAAQIAKRTPLPPAEQDRLNTIVETVGYAAASVRDHRNDLRSILLALHVQTQLWLNDIDRDAAA